MRIIDYDTLSTSGLVPHEMFFIELWYGMTHIRSLDSYRVKCMNSRTIIRELSEEIHFNLHLIQNDEIKMICEETKSIIEQDIICTKYFPNFVKALLPYLYKVPEKPDSKDKKKNQQDTKEEIKRFEQFSYLVSDFQVALEKRYFSYLCDSLFKAMKPNNEDEIHNLTSSLLTDLVDRGWHLEALNSWHQKFLPGMQKTESQDNTAVSDLLGQKDSEKKYSFTDNLKFMISIFQQPLQQFEVNLKLWNCRKLTTIQEIGQFLFSQDAKIEVNIGEKRDSRFDKFSKSPPSGCFAKIKVEAFDFLSAAVNARESFEGIVDLIRFEFEPNAINIDPMCHVKRIGDGKTNVVPISHITPNPASYISKEALLSFVKDIDAISNKQKIDPSSASQIQSGIRQYRFGRDSDDYKDKFLYWWLGLESMSRFDEGDIGITVTQNISHSMAIIYLHKLLNDLLITLKLYKVTWPQELIDFSEAAELNLLSSQQLLKILLDSTHRKQLFDLIIKFPVLSYYYQKFTSNLDDPKKTASYIDAHLKHLQWHINRLYRIRCCIVHGSPIRFRLRLFSANLEFYLKQTILSCINIFRNNDHIPNLEEYFLRATSKYDLVIALLNENNAPNDSIKVAVFSDVLLEKENI